MALLFLVHYRVSIPPFISFFLFSKIHRNNHFVMLLLSFAPQNISILFKILWKIHAREFPFQYSCRLQPSNVIKKQTPKQVFSREFHEIFKNILNKSANGYFITFAVLDCKQNWKKGTLVVKQNHRIGVQPYKRFLERTNKFFTRPCKSLYLPASAFFLPQQDKLVNSKPNTYIFTRMYLPYS